MQLLRLIRRCEELQRLAGRDPLTGLLNRYRFEQRLHGMFTRSKRSDRPFSIVMIDIDDFKQINDTHGHVVGDHVLKQLAQVLRAKTRKGDIQVRYGGEEFVVALPGAELSDATHLSNRICQEIAKLVFCNGASTFSVTVSVGVATSSAKGYTHWKQMLEDADHALYQAKADGKGCVKVAKSD